MRSTCRAVSAALSRRIRASAEWTCAGSRFRAADGVLGEFVQSADRDGGIGDGEPDGLKVRERLAELNPGAHMLGDDLAAPAAPLPESAMIPARDEG